MGCSLVGDMMSIRESKIGQLTESLASDSPTPGGGSAAAIALSQAFELAAMVSGLTIGRERWKEGWKAAEAVLEIAGPEARIWALSAADRDAEAFDQVMAAFRLPKGDESSIKSRSMAIQRATILAAEVPMEVSDRAIALLSALQPLAQLGNSNAITDVAVSALLAHGAAVGAGLNVAINASSLPDSIGAPMMDRVSRIRHKSETTLADVLTTVDERMRE